MFADVTVVVPTYNRARDLPLTLRSFAEQSVRPRHVIVVDNSSTDETEETVAACGEELTKAGISLLYKRNEPRGPASARNVGWRAANTQYVAFVDSDVTLDHGWTEAAASVLSASPILGAVAGRVVYAHRPDLLNCFGGEMSPIGLAWDADEGAAAASCERQRQVLWANCSALMVRRSALQDTEGFDEAFFYGFEDSDLGWRLNLAGWQVLAVPQATAFHRIGEEVGPAASAIVFHSGKNRLRSMLVNWGAARLLIYAPAYLAYALTDLVLRRPRGAKARALWWNVRHLPATLTQRRRVQLTRRVSDVELERIFANRWFPERRLSGLRRRPVDQETALPSTAQDDRV